jgi:putative ABC transport system permease protein
VVDAGAAVTLPIGGDTFSTTYMPEDQPAPLPGQEPSAGYQIVSSRYFAAVGMRVLAGRDFQASDRPGAPPVIAVNETLARQAWPGQDAIGRRVRFSREADDPAATVIAVVSDMRHGGPGASPRPELYQPLTQRSFSSMAFAVRTAGDPLAIVPAIRAEVRALHAAVPLARVATMEQHVARSISRPRFLSTLIAAFGALALALAIIGIYGVMAYSVAQRSQEIAIRMALGARRADVVAMVLSKAAALSGIGVAIGASAALALSRAVASLLFGVSPTDAATFAGCAVALVLVALLAAAIPAHRASRMDGVGALRT